MTDIEEYTGGLGGLGGLGGSVGSVGSVGGALCVHRVVSERPGSLPVRCSNPAEFGRVVCTEHLEHEPTREVIIGDAQAKMLSMLDTAVMTVGELMHNPDPKIRLAASQEVMNRAGMPKSGETVNVNITIDDSAKENLAKTLEEMVSNAEKSNYIVADYFDEDELDMLESKAEQQESDIIDAEVLGEDDVHAWINGKG